MKPQQPASPALISHVKRKARALVKKQGLKQLEALELLARQFGFRGWHELVTRSKARTRSASFTVYSLDTDEFADFNPPPSTGTTNIDLRAWVEARWAKDIRPYNKTGVLTAEDQAFLASQVFIGYEGDDRPRNLNDALAMFQKYSVWAPWYVWVDGVFYDVKDEKGAGHEQREHMDDSPVIQRMLGWFLEHYEDPANGVPYESADGGYKYIFGGPYDPRDEIEGEFPFIPYRYLLHAAMTLYHKTGDEWVKVGQY